MVIQKPQPRRNHGNLSCQYSAECRAPLTACASNTITTPAVFIIYIFPLGLMLCCWNPFCISTSLKSNTSLHLLCLLVRFFSNKHGNVAKTTLNRYCAAQQCQWVQNKMTAETILEHYNSFYPHHLWRKSSPHQFKTVFKCVVIWNCTRP